MKIQYLAPVTGGLVRCEASFLRKGRSFFFLQSQARRSDGELVAHATSTWTRRDGQTRSSSPAQRSAAGEGDHPKRA
jgi:acyl-coenzyme A thioesterase PaaI-like protein